MTTKGGSGNQNIGVFPQLVVAQDGTTTLLGTGFSRFQFTAGQRYIQLTAEAGLGDAADRGFQFWDNGGSPCAVLFNEPASGETYYAAFPGFIQTKVVGFLTDRTRFYLGIQFPVTEVTTATYSPTVSETILSVTRTGAGACTINLPTAVGSDGLFFIIKDEGLNALVNNITVEPNGAETIDGAANYLIVTNGGSITIYSRNSAWWIA
jgi:hypothetical protein